MHFSKVILAVVSSAAFFGGAFAAEGDATFYKPSLGICEKTHTASDLVAALSSADLNNKTNCGRSIRVNHKSNSVIVEVADLCVHCAAGSLDLSPAAFRQLANLDLGHIQVQWDWI